MKDNLLSIYIHIPYCISKCEYCDFYSVPLCKKNETVSDEYVEALCNEIKYRSVGFKQNKIKSIYIGGGTPSLLTELQLNNIFLSLNSNYSICENCEITIEVNPDDISSDKLNIFEKDGINRISCGIQSLNDEVLHNCKRRAKRSENLKALGVLKSWSGLLSLDLISGLPLETENSFFEGLNIITDLHPHHISMYSLTVEEETPMGKKIISGKQAYDFNFSDDLWIKGCDFLKSKGYKQYEVSNFALDGYECVHNKAYWMHQSYLGFGSGGTGTVYKDDGSGYRWTNIQNERKYIKFWLDGCNYPDLKKKLPVIEENISKEISMFEFFMMGFRLREGVSENYFRKIFDSEIDEKYQKIFKKWNELGKMEIADVSDDRIFRLNDEGILFLNQLLEDLI